MDNDVRISPRLDAFVFFVLALRLDAFVFSVLALGVAVYCASVGQTWPATAIGGGAVWAFYANLRNTTRR